MSWWPITVYGIAALLGLRTLFALMIQHRRRHLERLIAEENARREAEAQPEPTPDNSEVVLRSTAKAA